ncbi:MAG: DUF4386 family protein [Acidimicrobiia bacterium]
MPRIIPTTGLVGAVLLTTSFVASLFGAREQVSNPAMLMALPIAAWEFTIGVWMIVKGFPTTSPDLGETAVPAPAPTLGGIAV